MNVYIHIAPWPSGERRWSHKPEVPGSNPGGATSGGSRLGASSPPLRTGGGRLLTTTGDARRSKDKGARRTGEGRLSTSTSLSVVN